MTDDPTPDERTLAMIALLENLCRAALRAGETEQADRFASMIGEIRKEMHWTRHD